jgi:type VI secretion system secreted protein VgrG
MSDNPGAGAGPAAQAIDGGNGEVAAWSDPMLVLAAPGGVVSTTPASTTLAAGSTALLVANQAIEQLAQGHHASAVKDGVVLYTIGKSTDPERPNQETGIKIHAASGSVHTQSQSGATKLTADQAISISSTQGVVRITGLKSLLLTAGGAAIDIQPEGITLKAPGNIYFKGAVKVLDGPKSLAQSVTLVQPGPLSDCVLKLESARRKGSALVS